jgi:RimJ/RimL family protein N-acetyltransferase
MTKPFLTKLKGDEIAAYLETDHLIIRSPKYEDRKDLDHVIELQSDESVMKFVGAGGARDETTIKLGFDSYKEFWKRGDPVSNYMLFEKNPDGSEGKFAGMAALEPWVLEPRDAGKAEVMIYFMADFQGKGLGMEVGEGFFRLLYQMQQSANPLKVRDEKVHTLVATASPENGPSQTLIRKKLGFVEIGDRKFVKQGGDGRETVTKTIFELNLQEVFKKIAATTLSEEDGKSLDLGAAGPSPALASAAAVSEVADRGGGRGGAGGGGGGES